MKPGRFDGMRHAALAAAIFLGAGQAWAAGEVVVSASRWPQGQAQPTAASTVITARAIEQSGVVTVGEALARLAGVQLSTNGGWGKQASVFLRGTDNKHVLVLIDGVRIGSATTGSMNWAFLPAADVERIEIVKGPQSGLYGADAIGGVIQIFTKKGGDRPRARLLAEAGGLGSTRVAASIDAPIDEARYHLGVEGWRTQGVSAAKGGVEPDPAHDLAVDFGLESPWAGGVISLTVRRSEGLSAIDGGFPFGDRRGLTSRLVQQAVAIGYERPLTERWTTVLRLGRSEDALHGRDQNNAGGNYDIRTRIEQWQWAHRLTLADGVGLVLGLGQHFDLGINDAQRIHHRRVQSAAFAEASWRGARHELSLAVRRDRNSYTRDRTTWRLGAGLAWNRAWRVTANYGTGFKAPTLNDLFWPASPFSAGNPNLRPEDARGWDAGVIWTPIDAGDRRLRIEVRYFAEEVRDLIAWQQVRPFFWQPVNVDRARIRGWELGLRASQGALYLAADVTLQDPRDAKTNKLLARRARTMASARLGLAGDRVGGEIGYTLTGARYDDAANTQPLARYDLWNLRAWVRMAEGVRLIGRIENAGNKRYEPVAGYGARPRVVWLGVAFEH